MAGLARRKRDAANHSRSDVWNRRRQGTGAHSRPAEDRRADGRKVRSVRSAAAPPADCDLPQQHQEATRMRADRQGAASTMVAARNDDFQASIDRNLSAPLVTV